MGKTRSILRLIAILTLVGINVGCDQISKTVARDQLSYYERVPVIEDIFIMTKVENTGAFLGAGSQLSPFWKDTLLIGLPALLLVFMLVFIFLNRQITRSSMIALTMIAGGGIGNMIDRVAYGSVTDFLHLDFGIFRTGIFNLADVSVSVGVVFLVAASFMSRKPTEAA